MQFMLKQPRKRLVDEAVALQWLQSHETLGHNPQPEVPLARAAGMAGVRRTFVAHLQMRGREALLQQALDARRGEGSGTHEAWAARTSAREASHSACSIANSTKAIVSPKNLKLTQNLSLR